jgi:hypothetical protein
MTPEVCPKCGKPVLAPAPTPVESCPTCGVIFAKLQAPPPGEPLPSLGLPGVRRPIQVMKIPRYEPTFSWGLAVFHTILLCGLVAVFGFGLVAIHLIPEFAIGPYWRLGGFVFLLGLGVSRSFQLGKGAALLGYLAALVLLLGTIVYLMRTIQLPSSSEVAFSPQELQEMTVQPPRICHPALGVSFPEPGPSFQPAPETQKRLNRALKRPSLHHVWAFGGSEGLVVAQVVKGVGHNPVSLRVFAGALRKSALKLKAQVQNERFSEVEGRPAYHLAVDYPNGAQVDVRCLASGPDRPGGPGGPGEKPPLIFCLEGGGESRLFFQPMLGGMALRGCE